MSEAAAPAAAIDILVACGSDDEASAIAAALVERRLAACVQRWPIRSTYRWDGGVHHDDEVQLLVKTTEARVAEVESAILALHSYDLPAITRLPVAGATAATLDWLASSTRP